ncbi:LacI family DNA-binding transcriptional regulator [Novosphingobium sp. PhB55]|uniref:LacI family DNA-binding transcriptional regulator n=1 Tax=unclassified Novosphingobium TaxID=2644732 RepID=UPI0010E27A9C|nr:LacI family DNA-binding transcriptional regulator [Novosphingobium sp. PhB55]TDW63035.1 LacI family transcriptional regulator [Novosphingobium sp. PhB55]
MGTADDVARLAGVSTKTVSRVINGVASVAPELRDRVQSAINQLGYRPSLAARQLASHRNYLIALVVPRQALGFVTSLMIEIAAHCREAGYHLVMEVLEPQDWQAPEGVRLEFLAKPDSVILVPPFPDDSRILAFLEEEGIPAVRIGAGTDGYGSRIRMLDRDAARSMVEHLIDRGHRRIGMIGPPNPSKPAEARVEGWRDALAQAGIPHDSNLLMRGGFDFASGVKAATQIFALPERPSAIFAANDRMALAAMAVASKLGFSVPSDVAIAGFDDSPESRMTFPPLSTVRQPIKEIARAAVEAAIAREDRDIVFRQELRLRGSTTGIREFCADVD